MAAARGTCQQARMSAPRETACAGIYCSLRRQPCRTRASAGGLWWTKQKRAREEFWAGEYRCQITEISLSLSSALRVHYARSSFTTLLPAAAVAAASAATTAAAAPLTVCAPRRRIVRRRHGGGAGGGRRCGRRRCQAPQAGRRLGPGAAPAHRRRRAALCRCVRERGTCIHVSEDGGFVASSRGRGVGAGRTRPQTLTSSPLSFAHCRPQAPAVVYFDMRNAYIFHRWAGCRQVAWWRP